MGIHYFNTTQFVPATPDEVWDFFSSPGNLALITPPEMKFSIISGPTTEKIFPGQQIVYYVTPLWNLRLKWVTKITDVIDKEYFADEQLKGPYKRWQHLHFFKEKDGGIEMRDEIGYDIGYGLMGNALLHSIVRKKIEYIFSFRRKRIAEIFPIR